MYAIKKDIETSGPNSKLLQKFLNFSETAASIKEIKNYEKKLRHRNAW